MSIIAPSPMLQKYGSVDGFLEDLAFLSLDLSAIFCSTQAHCDMLYPKLEFTRTTGNVSNQNHDYNLLLAATDRNVGEDPFRTECVSTKTRTIILSIDTTSSISQLLSSFSEDEDDGEGDNNYFDDTTITPAYCNYSTTNQTVQDWAGGLQQSRKRKRSVISEELNTPPTMAPKRFKFVDGDDDDDGYFTAVNGTCGGSHLPAVVTRMEEVGRSGLYEDMSLFMKADADFDNEQSRDVMDRPLVEINVVPFSASSTTMMICIQSSPTKDLESVLPISSSVAASSPTHIPTNYIIHPSTFGSSEGTNRVAAELSSSSSSGKGCIRGGSSPRLNRNGEQTAMLETIMSSGMGDEDDQVQKMFVDEAVQFAESLPTHLGSPVGIVTPLLKHQSQALWWLMNRAYAVDSTHPCALPDAKPLPGVLLGDDMGLGKTLVTLSFIVDRKIRRHQQGGPFGATAPTADSNRNSNEEKHIVEPALLVCPSSVVSNWIDQTQQHAPTLSVLVCTNNTTTREQLKNADLVIVTYDYVRVAYTRSILERTTQYSASANESFNKKRMMSAGRVASSSATRFKPLVDRDPLFQIMWHCIILDEAHHIKNQKTKVFQACRSLIATADGFRICLSGTPIQNSSMELMSLIQFIRVDASMLLSVAVAVAASSSSATSINNNNNRQAHLHGLSKPPIYVLLDRIMLRRLKTQILHGAPIVSLPEADHEYVGLEPTPMQQLLQNAVVDYVRCQIRSAATFAQTHASSQRPAGVSGGRVDRRAYYTCLLGALRKMQQVADHGILPFQTAMADVEMMHELCHVTEKAVAASQCCSNIGDNYRTKIITSTTPTSLERRMDPNSSAEMATFGVMVAQLLDRNMTAEKEEDPNARYNEPVDPSLLSLERTINLSNKIQYLIAEMRRIFQQDPDAKVVIFSQFVQFLNMLHAALRMSQEQEYQSVDGNMTKPTEPSLLTSVFFSPLSTATTSEGSRSSVNVLKGGFDKSIRIVQLDGSLTHKKRHSVIHQFQTDKSTRIFLCSLRAGGEGVNLTAANWVYNADPWWNPATDRQALERVYRIGQTRKTHMRTLYTVQSVEYKILQLQERKRHIAKAIQRDSVVSGDAWSDLATNNKKEATLTQQELEVLLGVNNR